MTNPDANIAPSDPDGKSSSRKSTPISDAGSSDKMSGQHSGFLSSMPSLSRIMSVVVLVLGILGVGLLFYQVMAGFFVPLFLAALLVVIFRPVHETIERRLGGRRRVAAATTTGLILTIVLMPILCLLFIAAGQFASAIKQIESGSLKNAIKRGREQ
ncbi:MAG: AI-2E family transporter, partial [Planctomycetota bacterium]